MQTQLAYNLVGTLQPFIEGEYTLAHYDDEFGPLLIKINHKKQIRPTSC
jgi:hypothetical protein